MSEGWHDPKIIVAHDLGNIRIPFTYNQMASVSAVFSAKARRAHYDESAAEAMFHRWLSVDTRFTAIQFQPCTVIVKTNGAEIRQYTIDALFELDDGQLGGAEIKATPDYFQVPETADKLSFFDDVYKAMGIPSGVTRWSASDFTDDIMRNIKDIYDKRLTGFSASHAEIVRHVVKSHGGSAPLGAVAAALPLRSLDAQDVLCAMMCKRLVSIDLTRPFCPELSVTIPRRPANPGALRDFQRQFLPRNLA